jgi:hypothetical protein
MKEPRGAKQLAFLSVACYDKKKSPVAQLVERSTVNRLVKGSNPFWRVKSVNVCILDILEKMKANTRRIL